MIGKANEIKVVEFEYYPSYGKGREPIKSLDTQINEWLQRNSECFIVDIKYTSYTDGSLYMGQYEGSGDFNGRQCALLIYKV